MLLKSHRLIGIIRIESPVLQTAGDDDDSTIGGLFAGFSQRSLLPDAASYSRWARRIVFPNPSSEPSDDPIVVANLNRLTIDLESELAALNEVLA